MDYGARFYDASLARFHTHDPLAEKYSYQSPFVYAANNPVLLIDWNGLEGKKTNDTWGTMTIHSNVGPNAGVLAGHAWVEFKGNDGTVKTLSLWGNQGSREFFANKELGSKGVTSRTTTITKGDVKKINKFNSDPDNVDWNAGNTCAGYSAELWNTVTGESLDAANGLGIPNPSTLSQSIINANGNQNTNTANQNGTTANNNASSSSTSSGSTSSNSSANSGSSTSSSSSSSSASSTGNSSSAASSGGTGQKSDEELKKYTDTRL